ncbi:MAG: manganese efflux pump [Oscillospiraceae bacterium]|nr:manganese efflux pump [Oscillospiraceae bacterium]
MDTIFLFNSILLGVGLAMDAFSVSLANGLNEPEMKLGRESAIAGTFAGFQFLMPMLGWICVHALVEKFTAFQRFIPWIALALLAWIGGSMLREGLRGGDTEESEKAGVGFGALMVQGVATSIDALSVGFTIAEYDFRAALTCSLIIAAVTFAICMGGLRIGRAAGTRLSDRASILGGAILILIGLEIFIKGVF